MRDLMGMMKKAQELQDKMSSMQEEMQLVQAEGSSGAGLVTVTLSGKGDLKGLTIDASLIADGDAEIIEDLIVAAHADAKGKIETIM